MRPAGFHHNSLGWGYANTLDILDDLVADLALIQPSMSRCVTIDPCSDVVVEADVAHHLRGFSRTAQLFLQYAPTVARCAELATVQAYDAAAFQHMQPVPIPIIIPHISIVLPQAPVSPTPSHVANWNRGKRFPRQLEALRVMVIIWRLLPYVTFAPRSECGGWDSCPHGFHQHNLGWGYANTLDILDELVADIATLQPSMSQCTAIDPSSNVAVDPDVVHHLPGFCRPAQLLLQYALTVTRSISLATVQEYNPSFCPAPRTAIVIPHTSRFLPQPPASLSASQLAHWNRGVSSPREIEGLTIVAITRYLLPYATFAPRGDGAWHGRAAGFRNNSLGRAWANALDVLDELIADLALIQPSMSRCVVIDPGSDVIVEAGVAHHLQGLCRTAQLFLQSALQVARSVDLATVRAYSAAASPLHRCPSAALPALHTARPEEPWEILLAQLSNHFSAHTATLSANRLLMVAETYTLLSSAAQRAAVDIAQLSQVNDGQNQGEGDEYICAAFGPHFLL